MDTIEKIIEVVNARAVAGLDQDGNGKIDAIDFKIMAHLAEIAATKKTDWLAGRWGTLAVFVVGVAVGGAAVALLFRLIG